MALNKKELAYQQSQEKRQGIPAQGAVMRTAANAVSANSARSGIERFNQRFAGTTQNRVR